MKAIFKNILLTVVAGLSCTVVLAQNVPVEKDYYRIVSVPAPEGVELEVGGLALMPNGDLGVSTRRGDVWIISNPYQLNGSLPYYKKFASGMHEVLGLAYVKGDFYCVQRGELTHLIDKNGDGKADVYETVYSWPVSGNYHEYSYGPVVMPNGNMMVNLNVGFDDEWWRGKSLVPWRAWSLEITPDGEMHPYATGFRSPAGQGLIDGKYFYAENQGDWVGSGYIMQLDRGDFAMHPAGLRWAADPSSPVKVRLEDIYSRVNPRFNDPEGKIEDRDPNRPYKTLAEVAGEIKKGYKTPAVWIPHGTLGNSTSSMVQIPDNDSFGPFAGQVLVGDQAQSRINRVFLEQVKGQYQGAAIPFREGFESGVLRLAWGADNSLFVGQTSRGWGSTGQKEFGLERLVWAKTTPFEMKAVRAMPDGFEIEFTKPVNKKAAADPDNYTITGFTYKYHPVYGSATIREKVHIVNAAIVSEDGLKVRLVADSLREKYIHEIKVDKAVTSADNSVSLLHPVAYYTLNNIPDGEKLNVPKRHPKMDHDMAGMNMDMGKAKPSTAKAAPSNGVALKKNQTTKPASWTTIDQTVAIGTKPGLKFDKTEFTLKAGSKVKLTFTNNDDMPHNFVVVAQGDAIAVGDLGTKLGLQAVKLNYIANTPKILFNATLVGPGSSQTIYFVAPKPGKYTYVCTVPGHYFVMQGTLTVE
ncbi:plastocyanin/azurin family copper-binding protein [Mucilaginibacter sp. dw_454]|uniref:plastocyanin/azurin family copper-binding protein n=1 Tax=Mucilaginibacter sp. dw_454 TaxID=2720079 RepID=UPI001BD2A776|nr:plastocyanin/azurin family copper-binding protein [Mucilaginibacter sp. dw_454]